METQIINKTRVESKLSCSAVAKVRHFDCKPIALEINVGNTYYTYLSGGSVGNPSLLLGKWWSKSWRMKVKFWKNRFYVLEISTRYIGDFINIAYKYSL